MTTVDAATASAVAANSALSASASSVASGGLTDYDDFLNLLLAQLNNQDPLQPQDSSEWVAQLATFSSVEQQISANDKLDQLIALQNGSEINGLAEWINQDVTAQGRRIDYSGGDVSITTPPAGGADSVAVSIKDALGVEVARVGALNAGGEVVWDGAALDGEQVEAGLYQIDFVFTNQTPDGEETRVEQPTSSGRVVEARIGADGGTELILEGGSIVVLPSEVIAVRAPDAASETAASSASSSAAAAAASVVEEAVEAIL